MTNKTKTMIASAAIAGLISGTSIRLFAGSSDAGQKTQLPGIKQMGCSGKDGCKGMNGCKGKNECKGQGGCKSSNNGCKGKNDCKGKGGCAVKKPDAPKPAK